MTTLDDDQEQLRSNLELIGREDINDLEAVLSLVGHYDVEGFHRVPDNCPAEFTWDYEKGAKPQLDKLYEKAKKAQWNGADRPGLVDRGRPGEGRHRQRRGQPGAGAVGRGRHSSAPRSRSGTRRSSWSSGSRTRTGCCPSSCTASRARCSARPRSSRRCRGSTPSTTPPPR